MKNVELGQNIELITKGTTPTTLGKSFVKSGIPFLRAQNIINGSVYIDNDILFIDEDTHLNELKRSHINIGDVLLTIAGTIGRTAIVDDMDNELNCNQAVAIIRLGESQINANYLCKYLSSNFAKAQFTKGMVTATIANLSLSQIKKLKIPLPPLPEQKKIAAILDAADEYRQKTKALIAKYDDLAQSLFLDMFGDPVTNPMGWDLDSVENICQKILGGGTPSKSKPEYYIGKIPWVTPKDMKSEYISDSIVRINQEGIDNSSAKLIPKNNVLMVIRSGILKHTLPVAINTEDVTINQDMKAFIPDLNKTNSFFLKAFFQCASSFLLGKVRAVTADNIEFKQIKELPFLLPPIEIQTQFAERIKEINVQKEQAQKSLEESENLFNALLQKAFKGELT